MKCFEGTIITCDINNRVAQFLVEDQGKIVYVGNKKPEYYDKCHHVNLGDQALIPAFVDTHQHFASFSTFHAGLNVMNARSNQEIAEAIRSFAAGNKSKTLIAFGASPYSVCEGRLINREELDAVCPSKPIMVVKYDGHACIVNTLLLNKLKSKLENLRGYHPDTGEMNQEAFFEVSNYITNSLSLIDLVTNMQKAMDYMASRGIGMVHTVSGVGFTGNLDISMEKWIGQSAGSGFELRVFPQSLDIKTATKRGIPRIGGCFACALDGCYGSMDAAMLEPYTDGSKGVLYYSDEKVTDFCIAANRAGLQIEMHAIGDAAFDQATRALKAALDDYPREDHRHGIIHACLPTEAGIQICRDYHIQLPMQSAFIDWPQEPDTYLQSIMGTKRASALNPLRTLWDAGIVISAGSDGPCTDPDPILWIDRACNHSTPEERLTIQEALRMCTYNGAWTTFDEDTRGSLEVGKRADLVILSEDPYRMPAERLSELEIRKLYLKGQPYKPQKRGAVRALIKGLLSKNKNY